MSFKAENMTVAQLKSNLRDLAADTKDLMSEYLYWLRKKLKAQGARNDLKGEKQGFGPWVEENLPISRRTADTWADEWAREAGLMKPKSTSGKSSKGGAGTLGDEVPGERKEYFTLNLELTPSEQEQLLMAWMVLTEEVATRLFGAIGTSFRREGRSHQTECEQRSESVLQNDSGQFLAH